MLKTGQIYRIDRKEKFADIRQAFTLGEGKVVIQFRKYNIAKAHGERCYDPIDIYMDMEEFDFLMHLLAGGGMQQRAMQRASAKEKKPLFELMGGCGEKDAEGNFTGKTLSRILIIDGNEEKIFLKAFQGPGQKDAATGKIMPQFKLSDKDITSYLIPIDPDEQRKIGFAGMRAVSYFDQWSIQGVLEERVQRMSWKREEKKQHQ